MTLLLLSPTRRQFMTLSLTRSKGDATCTVFTNARKLHMVRNIDLPEAVVFYPQYSTGDPLPGVEAIRTVSIKTFKLHASCSSGYKQPVQQNAYCYRSMSL